MLITNTNAWHARRWTIIDLHPFNGPLSVSFATETEALTFLVALRKHGEGGNSVLLPPFLPVQSKRRPKS